MNEKKKTSIRTKKISLHRAQNFHFLLDVEIKSYKIACHVLFEGGGGGGGFNRFSTYWASPIRDLVMGPIKAKFLAILAYFAKL